MILPLLATAYVLLGALFVAFLMHMAPPPGMHGFASRRVIRVRALLLAPLWPFVLLVVAVAEAIPQLGDWIMHGRDGAK